MSYKRLLVVTGPQGSGNHLFSRLFSLHPDVKGWEELKHNYWVPSDEEPFAECWVNPDLLTPDMFGEYTIANVSAPFVFDGVQQLPKIREFVDKAESFGIDVTVCIIVRDKNIQFEQQSRVRPYVSLYDAYDYYAKNIIFKKKFFFISTETLFAYRADYMHWLGETLNFPVANEMQILDNMDVDPNRKYVQYVDHYWLDEHVWNGIKPKNER